jgi:hypothetical protein
LLPLNTGEKHIREKLNALSIRVFQHRHFWFYCLCTNNCLDSIETVNKGMSSVFGNLMTPMVFDQANSFCVNYLNYSKIIKEHRQKQLYGFKRRWRLMIFWTSQHHKSQSHLLWQTRNHQVYLVDICKILQTHCSIQ